MSPDWPLGWQLMLLEDCMSVIIDYRGKSPRKTSSGVPLVTAKVVKGGRILEPDEFIPAEDYDSWMRRGMPEPGDVVMTTEAPLGEIAQLDGRRVALAQRIIALRGKPDVVDNSFLKFAMQSDFVQEQLQARASGTTVMGIRQTELRRVRLPIPPLSEQRAIARVLGALDDQIEMNRRTNTLLEATARALFKSWFVDFDPVVSKAAGRQPDGLVTDIASMFPDRFVDSAIGPIPVGWEVHRFPEVVEINPRRDLRKGAIAPYLDMRNVPTEFALPEEFQVRACQSGMRFQNGDTLVARITPCLENGKTAYVNGVHSGEIAWGSTEFIVLHSKAPLPEPYSYFLARTDDFRSHAIANMTGSSGRQRVPTSCLDSYLVAAPPEKVAALFGRLADASLELMRTNLAENAQLRSLREALVRQLLSGRLSATAAARVTTRAMG